MGGWAHQSRQPLRIPHLILYRSAMTDPVTLTLTGTPVDGEHAPGCDDMQLPAQCPRRPLRSAALVGDFRTLRLTINTATVTFGTSSLSNCSCLGPNSVSNQLNSCYVPARVI